MKNLILVGIVCCSYVELAIGQDYVNLSAFVKEDITTLFKAYATPSVDATALSLARNWATTASTKKSFHFDVKFQLATISLSPSDQVFNLNQLNLTTLKPVDANRAIAPGLIGNPNQQSPYLGIWSQARDITFVVATGQTITEHIPASVYPNTTFQLPHAESLGFNGLLTVPLLQVNMGLIKNMELSFRYGQQIGLSYLTYHTYGMALKYNLNQLFFREYEEDSLLDFSLLLGYNHFDLTAKLNTFSSNDPILLEDIATQKLQLNSQIFNTEFLMSKNLLFLNAFLGTGYAFANSTIALLGNYPINFLSVSSEVTEALSRNFNTSVHSNTYIFKDPIALNSNTREFYTTIGLQIKYLWILNTSFSYTYGTSYQGFNVGIGLTVDKLVEQYQMERDALRF